jgi:hypothetical protein
MREYGREPVSIVFPRNQLRPDFYPALRDCGVTIYRGMEPHWMYHCTSLADYLRPYKRLGRLLDRYVPISAYNLAAWRDLVRPDGLVNLPSTRFLQPKTAWPGFEKRRLRWMQGAIAGAAKWKRIVHFWWHPHDFGAMPDENLAILRALLETAARCRESHGLRSITMSEAARVARAL